MTEPRTLQEALDQHQLRIVLHQPTKPLTRGLGRLLRLTDTVSLPQILDVNHRVSHCLSYSYITR